MELTPAASFSPGQGKGFVSKKVAVIGGGIAGLGAAAELLRQDCEVTLLEAEPRLGGRIHTIRDGAMVVELGAEFLHGQSTTLLTAIEAAGLAMGEVSLQCDVLEDGRFRREDVWEKVSGIIHRIDPGRRDCSFAEFLDRGDVRGHLRQMAVNFTNGFHAARAEFISAHSMRRAQYAAEHMLSSNPTRLDAGYSALIDFIAGDIRAHGGKILNSVTVKKISRGSHGAEIEFRPDNQNGLERLRVDAAVITVSLGVLKSGAIEFQPPLVEKQEAIEQLQFGNVVKIALVFARQCWPDFSILQAWDELLPTWWADSRGPVLTGWAGGPQADVLANLSSAQLERLALNTLKGIFPQQAAALQVNFMSSHSYNWTQNPHIRGAYSYIPVNGLDLPKLLAAPVADTLFFAGEATVFDAQTGLVSEAYETGLRAAREVVGHCELV